MGAVTTLATQAPPTGVCRDVGSVDDGDAVRERVPHPCHAARREAARSLQTRPRSP